MSTFRRKIFTLLAVAACAALLVYLSRAGEKAAAPRWDQRLAMRVVAPFSGAGRSLAARGSGLWRKFQDLRGADRENQILRDEAEKLRAQLLRLQEENRELRGQGLLPREAGIDPAAAKVARVIGYDPSPLRRSLTLDAGSEDGLRPDQVVIAQGGVVGRVLRVGPHHSRVLLITDLDSAVDVLAARSRARGLLVGLRRDLGLRRERWLTQAEYVSASEEIQAGDLLLTSGQDGVFPKGLPVGVVEEVQKDGSGLFWQAEVRPYAELLKLEEVMVLTGVTKDG